MSLFEAIAYSAIAIDVIGTIKGYFELTCSFESYRKGGSVYASRHHIVEHILILSVMTFCNFALIIFMISEGDTWKENIVDKNRWVVIALFGLLKIILSGHIKGERFDSFTKTR